VTCGVVLANKYQSIMNDDDSSLTFDQFVISWILMLVSGIFSTLGSLAFVRAFHEDPPMAPLFPTYYHLQSDELLASWLFFFATVPFVPYILIFLASSGYRSLLFLVGLGFAIVAAMGALLFVRACYPSDRVCMHYVR
jgi:predicted Kef-type K+ transport protein